MRVLSLGSVYPPHLLGGYEVIWQGVTRELVRRGHASRVLVSDFANPAVTAGTPEDPDVFRELEWYWEDHRWRSLSPRECAGLERRNAAVLDRHLSHFRPDVVAVWPMGGMSLSLLTRVRRAGLALIFFVLDPWTVYGPERDGWLALWSGFPRRALRGPAERVLGLPTRLELRAGRWVHCSEAMREEAGLRLAPAQETVLTPGIDDRFLPASAAAAEPWGWRLLYLGRVVEQKGVISAVEALSGLPSCARLTIVGSGDREMRRRLEDRARELDVAQQVTFIDQVPPEDTPALYAGADVVLHPVLWREPWGLVPLEAMGVGRPVIATGQGGSGDYLVDGVNALLHRPGDAAGLAGAIRRLAEDPELRARLVSAGRLTAAAHTAAAFERAAVVEIEQVAGSAATAERRQPATGSSR